jgi:selenocysteine lyase/cysteine desulfurase
LFELPAGVAYLNCAGLAPQLRSVRLAGERALDRHAAPWSIRPGDWFDEVERLRVLFARVAGADPDGVAVVPSTSYGLAVAAANTEARPGDRVVLLAGDFPSNVQTWTAWAERGGAEVVTVERRAGAGRGGAEVLGVERPADRAGGREADRGWTEPLLDLLDERVRVVSVPSVHWVDGSTVDLARVAARAREVGALLVVDATQSLGAVPIDIAAVRPDYLVAAGYKWLLGPLGTSYLYVAAEHRDGRPLEENWANRAGAEDFEAAAPHPTAYRPGARRFDSGQRSNFVLVPMAIAALEQVLAWGASQVAAALAPVTARIEEQARVMGFDPHPAPLRAPHMLGIGLPPGTAKRWAAETVHVELIGSVMRVSPHLHVTDRDLEMLFAELGQIDS